MLIGGCFCGAVRYEAGGEPFNGTLCWCENCRGTTGAPAVAWFSVARDAFSFTQGAPTRFTSSEHGVRSFCPACGTQLLFEDSRFPDEVDVSTASLDSPDDVPPRDQTYLRSSPFWGSGMTQTPGFDTSRTDRQEPLSETDTVR